jgi:hypothetical protein
MPCILRILCILSMLCIPTVHLTFSNVPYAIRYMPFLVSFVDRKGKKMEIIADNARELCSISTTFNGRRFKCSAASFQHTQHLSLFLCVEITSAFS